MVEPVKPDEISQAKQQYLPDIVIETWNKLIAKHFSGERANIKQDEAIAALMNAANVDAVHVVNEKWLDIEEVYRGVGWRVVYDKPAYKESYEASFTFFRK